MLRKLSKHCKRPNLLESFNRTWEGNRHMAVLYLFNYNSILMLYYMGKLYKKQQSNF